MAAWPHSIESRVKTMRVSGGRGTLDAEQRQHRHAHALLKLLLEVALGGADTVPLGSIVVLSSSAIWAADGRREQ